MYHTCKNTSKDDTSRSSFDGLKLKLTSMPSTREIESNLSVTYMMKKDEIFKPQFTCVPENLFANLVF